jgi:very-short-patch-repair endonuclease
MREFERKSRPLARSLRRRMTNAETILWSRLKDGQFGGLRYQRQHPIGPYVADFACSERRLAIELDGDQHRFDANLLHDETRDAFFQSEGWRTVRIANTEVYKNLSGVLEGLSALLLPPPSATLTPPPKAGE